jgi:ribosome-binding ATPase YchF (GTP1/OBG family)
MPIVTNTENKKFLEKEEIENLKSIQTETQAIILELGEVEMMKIQLEKRKNNAKSFLEELEKREKDFTDSIYQKYGKINLNPETGEINKLE